MRWPSRSGLTTTDVSGMLYGLGLMVSRDRLYRLADRLFPEGAVRPNGAANRRYTPEQFTVLRTAFTLQDYFGMPFEQVAELLGEPDEAMERLRQELQRRNDAVAASMEGLAEAMACVSIQRSVEGDSPTAAAGRHVA